MAGRALTPLKWSLSEFINEIEMRGQTWCAVHCDAIGGFSVAPDDRLRFYAVMEGTARLGGLSGGPIALSAGEIAIVLSGEAHAIRPRADSQTSFLDFMRDGSHDDVPPTVVVGNGGAIAARILCGRLKIRWPGGLLPSALPPLLTVGCGDLLVQVSQMEAAAEGSGAAGLLTRIATLLLAQSLQRHARASQDFSLAATEDPIARTLQMMSVHPSQPWTVSSLARKIGMGRSNFATRFATATGRTPMEMLAERRMLIAEDLLAHHASLKISEVATRVGYRSEAAFIRRFVRQFGVTPGAKRGAGADVARPESPAD